MKSINLIIIAGSLAFASFAAEAAEMPFKTDVGDYGGGGLVFTGPVKVSGRQLLVDFDQNGSYEQFIVRGVGYSPYPIGRHPSDWGWPQGDPRLDNILDDPAILNRDFSLLQQMHANAIRLWKGDDTEDNGRFPVKMTQTTLNLAEAYNIKVIAGFWVNTSGSQCIDGQRQYYVPDFTDPAVRNDYKQRFADFVNEFKNHPAVLFWAIGNENNYHLDPENTTQIQAWYSLANEMAEAAHNAEGIDRYHPVAVVNGDLGYIGDSTRGAADFQLPYVDIWGSNVYRGSSFGSFFSEFALKSAKPLWIAEYGADAWHTLDWESPDDGYENETVQRQWVSGLWDQIAANKSVTVGATVMEYCDEWWKPYEWIDGGIHNATQNHFGTGPIDTSCPQDGTIDWYPAAPDQFLNDEWWGVMSIAPNPLPYSPDIMTPRAVYEALQDRFNCPNSALYYAGPDNGKSCDGTAACCSSANKKSKGGNCVSSCGGSGCFLAGTPITMADGSQKPIEDIAIGDRVLAYDQETKTFQPDTVAEIFHHGEEDAYLIINGHLRVTPVHPVLSKGVWRQIGSLKKGDTLTGSDGKDVLITSIQAVHEPVRVYNFEVNPFHTYIAGGIVVHNRKYIAIEAAPQY